jgi:hypothetical protein
MHVGGPAMLQTSLQSSTILMMVAPGAGEQAAIRGGARPNIGLAIRPVRQVPPARLDHPPNDAPRDRRAASRARPRRNGRRSSASGRKGRLESAGRGLRAWGARGAGRDRALRGGSLSVLRGAHFRPGLKSPSCDWPRPADARREGEVHERLARARHTRLSPCGQRTRLRTPVHQD